MQHQPGLVTPAQFGNPLVQTQRRGPSWDMTEQDLGAGTGGLVEGSGLNIQFFYMRVFKKNAGWETRLCVAKQPKGDRYTIATQMLTEDMAIRLYPREYALFKENAEIPTSGTPLHDLPGITQSQISLLVLHGLRSVEDVAELEESTASTIGFEVASCRARARTWLRVKASNTQAIALGEQEMAIERENRELKAQLDQSNRFILELEARLKAVEGRGVSSQQAAPGGLPVRHMADDEFSGDPHDFGAEDWINQGPTGVDVGGPDDNLLAPIDDDPDPLAKRA